MVTAKMWWAAREWWKLAGHDRRGELVLSLSQMGRVSFCKLMFFTGIPPSVTAERGNRSLLGISRGQLSRPRAYGAALWETDPPQR